jgi:phosphoribosylanthranilate isomerase
VAPEIKFCGLTRPLDAAQAELEGGTYAGVVFAESPRRVSPVLARQILDRAPSLARVGVFGAAPTLEIVETAAVAGIGVIQLHGDPDSAAIESLRGRFAGELWTVVRVDGDRVPADAAELADVSNAIVLDTRSEVRLGGTGARFDWRAVAADITRWRGRARLVIAGGLSSANVAEAVSLFAPDVVDVSSGVESSPGVKDHEKMRAFAHAVGGRW